ncbi:hypothetical protein SENTW_3027 [Salmonella enterica subsp. enterica serovar Weltevreden str. 2007-60-3289-1]|nr:conserved hypothetical protein [Salmonella enterica subsp. enterica serovar Weltevreden str. HI_N05-537]CBY97108.1 hypothetical protein SENTW_3027 [Salmonella enterica subsp. enterica serovar Weltevreden str. 2007-60-3289-1]
MAVYPRWRGEHTDITEKIRKGLGLSPLARGTQNMLREPHHAHRFIPAGAGNTVGIPSFVVSLPVYPRWRGEHFLLLIAIGHHTGLSPLARGTQIRYWQYSSRTRFIPAGAGNTYAC